MRLFTVFLSLLLSQYVCSATLVVNTTQNSGTGSLRQAVLDAVDGDEIIFTDALFDSTLVLESQINISRDIQITGIEGNVITLDGNNLTRHFTVSSGAIVVISNLTLVNGRSSTGGAINNLSGNLTLINSMLVNNTSTGNGGAIDNNSASSLALMNTTVSNNSTSTFGGAINNPGNLIIRNSTLSNNVSGFDGGAITNLGGTLDITHSTVINNTATNCGGGIGNIGTVDNIQNTIVAGNSGNTGQEFCSLVGPGAIVSTGGNFIGQQESTPNGNTMGAFNQPNDQFGQEGNPIDPVLSELADHGGPTLVHLPLENSPVLNAGLNSEDVSDTDQRGFSRVVDNVDIGSVEVQDIDIIFNNGFEEN